MLLLALSGLRMSEPDVDVARALWRGDVQYALHLGLGRLERAADGEPERFATLGQVLGLALLAAGREESAEELFQKQLRLYEALPRATMRWLSSLDRGHLMLHLNKPGRAAEMFNLVADAKEAPEALRIEALAGLAKAMQGLGEHRRADATLVHAAQLAETASAETELLVEAVRLELRVSRSLRHFDDISAAGDGDRPSATELRVMAQALNAMPAPAGRLLFLAALMEIGQGAGGAAGAATAVVYDTLRWCRERRLSEIEERRRVEAALALLEQGQAHAAGEVLGPLAADDGRQQHHRMAIELRYCASKLHAMQGRHADALRCYRQHAQLTLARLRSELTRVPYSRFLEQQAQASQTDADQLRLPLRYRRAYQFIVDHLHERTLSVRRIAAQIDVTERALQMAFRTHLGLTPAEVIRKLRMSRIRTELQHQSERESVLSVAARWGLANRSTLAQNYREQFGETPTGTSGLMPWHDEPVDARLPAISGA